MSINPTLNLPPLNSNGGSKRVVNLEAMLAGKEVLLAEDISVMYCDSGVGGAPANAIVTFEE